MDTEVSMINNVISMASSQEPLKKTGIGARLKAAREAMHLSEKEAAARLYLSVKMITLMEGESFSEGPPATFVRGYLHSYARLLDFPESEINQSLKDLENHLPIDRLTPPVVHKQNPIHYSDQYFRWITPGIIIVLLLLVSIWWHSHSKDEMTDVPIKPPSITKPIQAAPTTVAPLVPTVPAASATPAARAVVPSKTSVTATAPMIPLAAAQASTVNSSQSVKANKKIKAKKQSARTSKVKNITMSLPEPGSD